MRNLFSSLILLCATSVGFAQTKPIFGIKAGANYSTFSLKGTSNLLSNPEGKGGFLAGIFVNIPVASKFSIQPEAFYSQMGAYINNSVGQQPTFRLNYFSVPLLAKINVTNQFSFVIGPEADVVVGANRVTNNTSENVLNNFKESSFAGVGGVELWPVKWLGITGRYIYGFSDISKTPGVELYNRGAQLALHIAFLKKPQPKPVVTPEPEFKPQPRPADTDEDGIPDAQDQCPEIKGIAKYNGCPIPDTDKDGINDEEDKCPTVAGVAKYNGCPIPDSDNDGLNDEEDKCPTAAGPKENNGCPVVKKEVQKKVEYAAKNIFFNKESAKLLSKSFVPLNEVVKILQEDVNVKLSIDGYADNTGSDAYNQKLTEARANAVKDYLISKGVDASRLTATGHGENDPIATNKTAAGRAKNRRVEMHLSY
jgi:outer membrane protein OmpA-like peptidoglycan-associated protein